MPNINVDVPEIILETHQNNILEVQTQLKQGLIILEYLNGNLGIAESGDILGIGPRIIDLARLINPFNG